MLSADLLREHLRTQRLEATDQVYPINQSVTNRYIKRLATKLFGNKKSPGGIGNSFCLPRT
jgi:hypothetical protein